MYKIGDFAKIVDIPVRTLRYYDECGILQPSEVDSFTGYRYYSDDNIIECELIKLLKSVDFTLEEIILYKNNFDSKMLVKKQQELLLQIELLKKRYKRLSLMREELEKSKTPCKIYKRIKNEIETEKILRRNYERRNIKKD